MFDLDQLATDCHKAVRAGPKAVREVIARAVREPGAVIKRIGEPKRAGIEVLHRSKEVTILNLIWGPNMILMPHDHRMWAVIGIYTGREDNIFWRRLPDQPDRIEAAGARSLCVGEAFPLGQDVIHSVLNPISRLTGAIHVYGGDFLEQERSGWDPETLVEGSYDAEKLRRSLEESNQALGQA
ncbi:MAG: hypothetical protein ACREF3_04340 [Acetobacteraceae bacterium]